MVQARTLCQLDLRIRWVNSRPLNSRFSIEAAIFYWLLLIAFQTGFLISGGDFVSSIRELLEFSGNSVALLKTVYCTNPFAV